MTSGLSTRFLLLALAALIALACAYFLLSALNGGGGAWGGGTGYLPPITVKEKAHVLNSLSQTSAENAGATLLGAQARQRVLEIVAQSSGDSPAAQQSDTDKLKVLNSLSSQ